MASCLPAQMGRARRASLINFRAMAESCSFTRHSSEPHQSIFFIPYAFDLFGSAPKTTRSHRQAPTRRCQCQTLAPAYVRRRDQVDPRAARPSSALGWEQHHGPPAEVKEADCDISRGRTGSQRRNGEPARRAAGADIDAASTHPFGTSVSAEILLPATCAWLFDSATYRKLTRYHDPARHGHHLPGSGRVAPGSSRQFQRISAGFSAGRNRSARLSGCRHRNLH